MKNWVKYAKDDIELNTVKQMAKDLRDSGEYKEVKIRKTEPENGKDYGLIYVIRR